MAGKFVDNSAEFLRRVQRAERLALAEAGEDFVAAAVNINIERAYDTGRMTSGWYDGDVEDTGNGFKIEIGNDSTDEDGTPYWYFVDQGTIRMAPRDISGHAAAQVAPRLGEYVRKHLP